jgi:predicted DNA-binding transcriptional regulator AlpA
VKNKQFPQPVKIGTANRWMTSDLEEYLATQIAEARKARNGGAK